MVNINTSGLNTLMVFDAIDEAEDDRIVSFVETLVSRPGSLFKAILLSRPTDAFDRPFWEENQVTLQNENKEDIHIFVQYSLSKLGSIMNGQYQDSESELPAQGDYLTRGPTKFKTHAALRQTPSQNHRSTAASSMSRRQGNSLDIDLLGKNVRERAEGVILWVVLVFDAVFKFAKREPLVTLEGLISCIEKLPRDINGFYSQMIKDLTDTMSGSALCTARKALMWINTANQFTAFTLEQLWDALASSQGTHNPSTEPSTQALVNGRIEIESWKDFNRILRRLCGSLIEILPPKSSSGLSVKSTHIDFGAFSGECVIHLMHQTVKDFLTSSREAGVLSFTEASAQEEVLRGCQYFIRSTLPDDIASITTLPRNRPQDWIFFSANMARHLDEFRLFPVCLQLFKAFPDSMEAFQIQLEMKWYWLLPQWLHDIRDTHDVPFVRSPWAIPKRERDPREPVLFLFALHLMFQFIAHRGLRGAARNLLTILDMGTTTELWRRYRDVMLKALASTIFDLESGCSNAILGPRMSKVARRERTDLAPGICDDKMITIDDLVNAQEGAIEVSLENVVETIKSVLDYKTVGQRRLLNCYTDTSACAVAAEAKPPRFLVEGELRPYIKFVDRKSERKRRKLSGHL